MKRLWVAGNTIEDLFTVPVLKAAIDPGQKSGSPQIQGSRGSPFWVILFTIKMHSKKNRVFAEINIFSETGFFHFHDLCEKNPVFISVTCFTPDPPVQALCDH